MFPVTKRHYSWVESREPVPNTTIGTTNNENINRFGQTSQTRINEDRYYTGRNGNIQLCMVLDGHQGESAAEFAVMNLAGRILSESHIEDPKELLERVFHETENSFFLGMDDPIGRRLALKSELSQRPLTSYEANNPQQKELERLDSQIKGGTTVVLSLICGNNLLYTANIGDSRAVLCEENESGQMRALQLSDDHNVFNPDEQERLRRIGLDTGLLLQLRRLGPFQITRSIGDYLIKGGYMEVDVLRSASKEPGICTPFVNGPWDISSLRNNKAFLILMSDGLYEAYGSCIQTKNPPDLHTSLARLVADEMKLHNRMDRVGPAVVNRVREQFKEIHRRDKKDGKLDDMTLIVQNFSYPMSDLTPNYDHVDSPVFQYPSQATPTINPAGGGRGGGGRNVSPLPAGPFGGHTSSSGSESGGGGGGGVFVEESSSPPIHSGRQPVRQPQVGVEAVAQEMSRLHIEPKELFPEPHHHPQQQRRESRDSNRPRELTDEELESGKYIKPYILFPNDFPFDMTLDSIM